PRGEVYLYSVGAEYIGQRRHFFQVGGRQHEGVGIYVRHYASVDTDGSIGPGIIAVARVDVVGKFMPVPQREPRVTAFYCSVEVVPMVEDTVFYFWNAGDGQIGKFLVRLNEFEEMKYAVKNARIAVGGYDDGFLIIEVGI